MMKKRSMDGLDVYLMSLVALLMSDLWMWGITPPPAIVACTQSRRKSLSQLSRP